MATVEPDRSPLGCVKALRLEGGGVVVVTVCAGRDPPRTRKPRP